MLYEEMRIRYPAAQSMTGTLDLSLWDKPAVVQRLGAGSLPRHRHGPGYATIVLSGGYVEAGDAGRWRVGAGDVLVHREFEAHLDVVAPGGSAVLNFPTRLNAGLPSAFRVTDPDLLIQAARQDPWSAAEALTTVDLLPPSREDWPDMLAAAISRDPQLKIGDWAVAARLAPATVSRGFRAAFGTTPTRYRAEARARLAWHDLMTRSEPLATIALDNGFADQSHCTRAVTALTGFSPTAWRKVKSVQDGTSRST